jgi:hypothetical protein
MALNPTGKPDLDKRQAFLERHLGTVQALPAQRHAVGGAAPGAYHPHIPLFLYFLPSLWGDLVSHADRETPASKRQDTYFSEIEE